MNRWLLISFFPSTELPFNATVWSTTSNIEKVCILRGSNPRGWGRGTGVRVHSTHRLDRRLKLSFRIPSHSARLTQSHGLDVLFSFRLRDPINCHCALVNQSGGVAQMVERTLSMREAQGSIPCSSTLFSTSSCLR